MNTGGFLMMAGVPLRALGCSGFLFFTANEQKPASAISCSEGCGGPETRKTGTEVGVRAALKKLVDRKFKSYGKHRQKFDLATALSGFEFVWSHRKKLETFQGC